MGLEWAAFALLLASALLGVCVHRESARIAHLAQQLERTAALKADLRWWQASLRKLAQWQEAAESGIDGGTQAVRAVHQGIAAVPFGILEAIPATRETTRLVRGLHDFTADNVYAAVSAVNRLLGAGSRRLIEGEPGPRARELPEAGRPTAAPERSRADDPARNDP